MRKARRIWIGCMAAIGLFAGILSPCPAQQTTFSASASSTQVALGEQFQITFTVSGGNFGSPRDFRPPNLNADFLTLMGPSTSQQMSIINGRTTGSFAWVYVLQARNAGTFTIPAAAVTVAGKVLKSNPVTIKVSKSQAKPRQQQGTPDARAGNVSLGDNLFIRAIPDKRQVYIGEPIFVSYKLYSRIPLQLNSNLKLPRMVGFWSEEVPQKTVDQKVEVYKGKQYETAVLRKIVYFPTQAGHLTISPFEIDVTVQVRERRKTGDPFYDEFFSNPFFDAYKPVTKTLMTEKITVDAKGFPAEGRPEHFKDMVGSYTMKTEIDKTAMKAGESATLKVTIGGTGNIRFLEEPYLALPNDVDHYPPVLTESLDKESGNITGTKTFEYVLIPRFSGDRVIQPVEFSYFDPARRKYMTLKSPEYTLTIAEAPQGDIARTEGSTTPARKREMLPLRRLSDTDDTGAPPIPSTVFLLCMALLPAAATIAGIVAKRRYDIVHADVTGLKMRKATRLADKRLARSKKFLNANDIDAYYLEVARAVFGYLQDRMNIPTFDLSQESVRDLLAGKSVSPERIDEVLAVTEAVEYARYSPTRALPEEMRSLYGKAHTAIIGVEQELR